MAEESISSDTAFKEVGVVRYYDNGDIEIGISPFGIPKYTSIYPSPGTSEEEREKSHQDNLRCITIEGYILLEAKRIKNKVFDKSDERTSWQYKYRICKNEDEAKGVLSKIKEIMKFLEEQKREVNTFPTILKMEEPI